MANRDQLDSAALQRWFTQAHALMGATMAWVNKKKKHEPAGVALITQLQCLCLQQPGHAPKEFEAWVEKLQKWLKDKLFSDVVRNRSGQLSPCATMSSCSLWSERGHACTGTAQACLAQST